MRSPQRQAEIDAMMTAEKATAPFYVVRTIGHGHLWYEYRRSEPDYSGDYHSVLKRMAEAYTTVDDANVECLRLRKELFALIRVIRIDDKERFLEGNEKEAVYDGELWDGGRLVDDPEFPRCAGGYEFHNESRLYDCDEHREHDMWTLYGTDAGEALIDVCRTRYDKRLP